MHQPISGPALKPYSLNLEKCERRDLIDLCDRDFSVLIQNKSPNEMIPG